MAWRPEAQARRGQSLLALGLAGLILLPVLAGLAGTAMTALSNQGIGFQRLQDWPGLSASLWLSLRTGVMATVLSFGLAMLIVGALSGTVGFARLRRLLSPLLALPHAAAALGLAFLIAPSGWIARALSPWATGWTTPPDLLILNDPMGISLTLGLVVKETPFLLLMALAALPQTDAGRRMTLAATLGYGRVAGFAVAVLPPLARQMRLGVHAVLAYGLTSVDMAMVLGPSLPPPLAVQVLHWANAPDLASQPTAAAGALVLLIVVGLAIAGCEALARLSGLALRRLAETGQRGMGLDRPAAGLAQGAALAVVGSLAAGLAGLSLWSVAGLWPFPDLLPSSLTGAAWDHAAADLTRASLNSAGLGLAATLLAMALALALLQAEARGAAGPGVLRWSIYLPLLVPQVTILPGMATAALLLGGGQGWATVVLGHLTFVLPYVLLSLSDPWHAWDQRIGTLGATLGASPGRIFWRLRLPMLLPAILTAAAVGFATSVGQYLPTLILSGGRVPSLTTEALALASGGNRRLIGAYAVLQMVLPMAGFLIALTLPRLIFAGRRGMGLR